MEHEKSCGTIIIDNNKVLLIGAKDDNGQLFWSFPKGHQEDSETDIETAIRETFEEVGLETRITDQEPIYVNHPIHNESAVKDIYLYFAEVAGGEIKPQDDEVETVKWASFEEVDELLSDYYKAAWDEAKKRKMWYNKEDMDLPEETKTYVYIDVSNIRYACLWSCGFNLDFIKLYDYFKDKYPNLQEVRYYEGVSYRDKKKLRHFRFLSERIGYKICSLSRKGYVEPARYETFECENCKFPNKVKVLPENVKMKSNVDVYLTSDLLECAAKANEPINFVILSCDGDYAEAIKAALRLSPDSRVTVLATPMTEINNCLSVRLKHLSRELDRKNYKLANVYNIRDYISQPLPENPE